MLLVDLIDKINHEERFVLLELSDLPIEKSIRIIHPDASEEMREMFLMGFRAGYTSGYNEANRSRLNDSDDECEYWSDEYDNHRED